MATATYKYRPDYAVSPGSVLAERLATHGISQAEFARRCGRSPKLISEIVAGKAPIEPKTALEFERVLNVAAHIWLGIESDYRLHQARLADQEKTQDHLGWSRRFPVKEMAERGLVSSTKGESTVSELLSFFGVASVQAWEVWHDKIVVAYRHSPSFESNRDALAVWLRAVQLRASEQDCGDCDLGAFKKALTKVRQLTRESLTQALAGARTACNATGVAFVVVKPFSGMRLSGAAWWPSSRNPVIALTARHKTDDQLWFSMFHEAAHILFHGKQSVFIDGPRGDEDGMEHAANRWAADFLIPPAAWRCFLGRGVYDSAAVNRFADDLGIAPGIVVGRLQHEEHLRWNSKLNSLKVKLRWADEPTPT